MDKEYIIYIKHDSKISRFYKKVSNKTIRRKGRIDIKDLSEDNYLNEYKYENLFLDKFKCHKLYDYWWRVL